MKATTTTTTAAMRGLLDTECVSSDRGDDCLRARERIERGARNVPRRLFQPLYAERGHDGERGQRGYDRAEPARQNVGDAGMRVGGDPLAHARGDAGGRHVVRLEAELPRIR